MIKKIPKITVLMPVYNGEKYLRQAIESILNQTFTDFEFLIINDGSTDKTGDIIKSYYDPRIRLFNNPKNLQIITCLNKGLALSKGEYIARMDCDDICLPNRLQKQIEYMESHQEIGALGNAIQLIDQKGEKSRIVRFPLQHHLITWRLCFSSPLAHPAVIIRRKALKKLKVKNNHYYREYAAEDYDLWRRITKVTKIENLPDVLLLLRKHPANLSDMQGYIHLEKTAAVSCVVISDILGKTSYQLVQYLGNWRKPNNNKEVYLATKLLLKLHRKFLTQNKLTSKEKVVILFDIIKRLTKILLSYIK